MVLEARAVSFAYGPRKWAIRNLNFALPAPRRVCLLGANGVGKSTLMLLINGTLRPQEGELLVLGEPIDYSRSGLKALRRRVGIVLQDPDDQLFGATVEQDVAFGLLNNGVEPAHARVLVNQTLGRLGSRTWLTGPFMNSAWAKRSASRLPEFWFCGPASFCWMSRPPVWTSPGSLRCSPCSTTSIAREPR